MIAHRRATGPVPSKRSMLCPPGAPNTDEKDPLLRTLVSLCRHRAAVRVRGVFRHTNLFCARQRVEISDYFFAGVPVRGVFAFPFPAGTSTGRLDHILLHPGNLLSPVSFPVPGRLHLARDSNTKLVAQGF